MNLLKSRLRDFMLSGIYNSVEERIAYSNDKGISYTEFPELLLEDEVNNRRANEYKKRYAKAKLPYITADGTVYFATGVPLHERQDFPYVEGPPALYAISGSGELADTAWPKFRRDLPNTGRQ